MDNEVILNILIKWSILNMAINVCSANFIINYLSNLITKFKDNFDMLALVVVVTFLPTVIIMLFLFGVWKFLCWMYKIPLVRKLIFAINKAFRFKIFK